MKLKLDLHGVILEWERKPMHPARFRRLCVLAAVALYVGMVIGVTALSGIIGLALVMFVTIIALSVDSI